MPILHEPRAGCLHEKEKTNFRRKGPPSQINAIEQPRTMHGRTRRKSQIEGYHDASRATSDLVSIFFAGASSAPSSSRARFFSFCAGDFSVSTAGASSDLLSTFLVGFSSPASSSSRGRFFSFPIFSVGSSLVSLILF